MNNFKVKEKTEKKIIIEEEQTKNPLLLFFKRHKKFILAFLITLAICLILASIGLALSLFQGSNDYDITYVTGSNKIDSNNNPEIDDSDVKEELLGEIARENGIVILVETLMSSTGDVITYYSDGTSVVVTSNGKIYRISTTDKGNYGIDKNGKIDKNAKKILVTSTTSTLQDGTIITYYSDGSAKVQLKNEVLFVRDSNNIKLNNGSTLNNLSPSGVSLTKETSKVNDTTIVSFTDKTALVIVNGKKRIVNKNANTIIAETEINYSKTNSFEAISEKTYDDGNTITHFANGSAIITDKEGNIIYVAKSGDLLLKNKKIYEIMPNDYGYSRTTINCQDGKKVTYFDNGAAIIINQDGTKQYVEDNTEIIYDNSKNISTTPTISKQVSKKTATSGEEVINFDNGKSQVIKSDGTSYITDTSKLTFKTNGEIINPPNITKPEENKKPEDEEKEDPGAGIEISEAENKYNEEKNIEDTTFLIKNNNNKNKVLRITIQEVTNYKKYGTTRLNPKHVKFQATIGDNYIPATIVTKNTWTDSSNIINYTIYDGTIKPKQTLEVALSLYVNYEKLTNEDQNKGFIGTIKIYVEDTTK